MQKLLVSHDIESGVIEEVVAIEYRGVKPFSVQTHVSTDNREKAWFKPGDAEIIHGSRHYDFEWSRNNESLYWHMSGCGGSWTEFNLSPFPNPSPPKAKLWLAPGVQAVEYLWKTQRTRMISDARMLAMGYQRIAMPLSLGRIGHKGRNPFDAAIGDTDCVYCKFCDDYLPDTGGWLCNHIFWCDDCEGHVYELTGGHIAVDAGPDSVLVKHEEVEV